MREINLREFYPEIYKEDYVVSLPDEVVERVSCFTLNIISYMIVFKERRKYQQIIRNTEEGETP